MYQEEDDKPNKILHIYSAIGKEDVRPGLSMPYIAIYPGIL